MAGLIPMFAGQVNFYSDTNRKNYIGDQLPGAGSTSGYVNMSALPICVTLLQGFTIVDQMYEPLLDLVQHYDRSTSY